MGDFFLYFVEVFNPKKSLTIIAINGTNEGVTRRFEYPNLRLGQKVTNFNFFRTKRNQNFVGIDFEHSEFYRDEKFILAYNLSFKKFHISKPGFEPKNNTFQFYENKKHNETFAGTYSKLLYIYREAKHILVINYSLVYYAHFPLSLKI